MADLRTSMVRYPEFITLLYENIENIFKLNILFLLFSLPVITIPAAYTGMTMSFQKLVRGEPLHVWDDFWRTFRSNILTSLAVGLPVFGLPALCFYTVPFYRQLLEQSSVFYAPLVVCFLSAIIALMAGFYAFPMLAAVDLPLRVILKNAVYLAFIRLWQNLLALAVIALITILVIATLPVSVLILVGIYFSLCCAIGTFVGWGGILDYVLSLEAE